MKKTRLFLCIAAMALALCAAAMASEGDTEQYRVGIDDILDINIIQPTSLSNTVTVTPNGSISFPYIGDVVVKDKSLSEIKKEVETRLADGYMKYPLVSVFLRESRSRKFLVYGDVMKPGMYSLSGDTTVLKGISLAGGFSKNSLATQVKVLHPAKNGAGNEPLEIDIKKMMQGAPGADVLLVPGDIILVSEGKFFVYGEVSKPGIYPLEAQTSVLRAIAIAGGLKKNSSSVRVSIQRPGADGKDHSTIPVDLSAAMRGAAGADLALRSEDTLVVTEESFFVEGDVNKPGVYPMDEDATVLKAVSLAGGVVKNGAFTEIKVIRPGNPASDKPLTAEMKDLIAGGSAADIRLQPGDTVMVSQGKFYVYGEVVSPGIYPLEEKITVLKAIAMAGGFNKYGSSSRVKILRYSPTGEYETIKVNVKGIMDGEGKDDIELKPSDTVVVFEGVF